MNEEVEAEIDTNYDNWTLGELVSGISNTSYHLGIVIGLSRAAKYLNEQSGKEFAVRHDDTARALRTHATLLEDLHKIARANYDSMRTKCDTLWEELDRREKAGGA